MARPKTYDRDEVLQKAIRLFWDKGYEGAHLRELVAVTGISRFSLYQEFGSKNGLFEAALGAYIEGLGELGKILLREPPGLANIRAHFQGLIDFGFRHGCFALNTIREKHVVPKDAFAAVEDLVQGGETNLLVNLEAAIAAEDLPESMDAVATAKLLTALEVGMLSYGILEPEGLPKITAALEQLLGPEPA